MPRLPRGLYAITPDDPDTDRLAARVAAALEGGAAVVQYRNKTASPSVARLQAMRLSELCRTAGVPLIVNDDPRLALEVDAAGAHLGGTDGDLAAARALLGPERLLGASCYDRPALAATARGAGADHIAFGAVFASATKPAAVRAPLALFGDAAARAGLPAVAIGGITTQNAAQAIAAGAHALAVISDLFDAPDIAARARIYRRLFERPAP
jgi:thiamine-phosphate pyrophosphorylase